MNVQNIDSPFEGNTENVTRNKKADSKAKLGVIVAVVVVALLAIAFFLLKGSGEDRYRTLEALNFNEALDNHERLLGGAFKVVATVDADLGTELGKGKLIAFRDTDSSSVLPVLIPSHVLDGKTLNKGQQYQMEVEVLKGGIVNAKHIEKK